MNLNRSALWVAALLVLGGCGSDEPELSAVTVKCEPATVAATRTAQCKATATDQDGQPFTVSGFSWTSSNEAVAKVDATGKVTTLTPGSVTLGASATSDGVTKQGQAPLTVTQAPPQLSAVTVKCEPATVAATRPSQCTASATDQYGQAFTVSGFSWTSSNEAVAIVDATGKVTTFTAGSVTLGASATSEGVTKQGQAPLTVTEPTLHATAITTSETWLAAANPHVVRGSIAVSGSAQLTLEPGVELRFEQDAELRVTQGTLLAKGTEQAPINMVAHSFSPTKGVWRGVVFATEGSASELRYVTLRDCGGASGKGACIALENKAAPVLDHVTVRNSGTAGVTVADDGSAFGAGSTTLSVFDSASHAVSIGANEAGTLPTGGTFTGNAPQAVVLRGNVARSQTWPNPGIPYVIQSDVHVEDEVTPPTLTLSAGTVLRFGSGFGLFAGYNHPSELIVNGTEAEPVLFTADAANPQPGHWRGVHLGDAITTASRITHATIEYGGSLEPNKLVGNLNVYGDYRGGGARPVIQHVTVRKGSHYGFFLEDGRFGPDSTALTARDNGGAPIVIWGSHIGTIPSNSSFSGNTLNEVHLRGGAVRTNETWPNLGMPYVLLADETIYVGSDVPDEPRATLTLLPGTELRFAPGSGLFVGIVSPGALIAKGTAEVPIRFISSSTSPTQGSWIGLHFWDSSGSQLEYVHVSHAGEPSFSGQGTGNVNVYREIGAFMTNSTLSESSGCGITRSTGSQTGSTAVTTDFTLATHNNTFTNNTGGEQCAN